MLWIHNLPTTFLFQFQFIFLCYLYRVDKYVQHEQTTQMVILCVHTILHDCLYKQVGTYVMSILST